jgi:hypothetical protein
MFILIADLTGMSKITILGLILISCCVQAQRLPNKLPVYDRGKEKKPAQDWLVHPCLSKARVYKDERGSSIILSNGLLKRTFSVDPGIACIDFENLVSGEQLIRSVRSEATFFINGKKYDVGGLAGQKENAYLLPEWVNTMKSAEKDFIYKDFQITSLDPLLPWKSSRWAINHRLPQGIEIAFRYEAQASAVQGLQIKVHYAVYEGLPLICKWVSCFYTGDQPLQLNRVINEMLAVPEEESAVVGETGQMKTPHGIYVETNYAFNNAMRYDLSDQTTHWKADSSYTSQVNYQYKTPCLLEVYTEKGPGITLQKGDSFVSVKTFELLLDSYDRERRGLSVRKMYNTIAPWTTENPIFMHLVSKADMDVRNAVDQCAATGYEALILSFGSHCDMEDTSAVNIRRWKTLADYAHKKNILIGSYSLFSSRRISDEDDVIDPVTGKPDAAAFFEHAPCYGSRWGLAYLAKLKYFISQTGFNLFENDGPYPGDLCASTRHPGHKGLEDSQWKQMELQKSLYHWCNAHNVYVNAPDWYFLDGTNKIALGYREVNFSLPREQQLILNRQNIFDGTWEKTSTMSWGFVPLTKYQGGGPEAVLEPLAEHLRDYTQLMVQYYGAGIQACYRGPRLYDTEKTKQEVIQVVGWYKQYRSILNAPIIHLRRADGRDWDGWLHVDPSGKTKAMLFLFNPLKERISRMIQVPLYYSGLTSYASIREKEHTPINYSLQRDYSITIPVNLEAESYTWFIIE